MKKFITVLFTFIFYFNSFTVAHAAAKNYNVKTLTYDPLERVIRATTLDRIAEKTMQRSARVPVTASATGSTVATMIRLGVAGAVIYGVVEGAGWLIQNGVVVKRVSKPDFPDAPVVFASTSAGYIKYFYTEQGVRDYITGVVGPALFPGNAVVTTPTYLCPSPYSAYASSCVWGSKAFYYGGSRYAGYNVINNTNYNPENKPSYEPVPENDLGDKINNSPKAPQILPEVYNPNNPAGGPAPESTADAIDRSAPEPETQPTGNTKPKPNVDTNGDGVPDTYDPTAPTAGEEFELPAFCEWATTMCVWYEKYREDSKKTDDAREKEQTHRETEKVQWQKEDDARQQEQTHREKQLTFWEKVEEWFDWTKEEPEKEEEQQQPEIDDQGIFTREFDTVFSLSNSCPSDLPINFESKYINGSFTFSLRWLCIFFTFIGYPLQLLSHCIGIWILYETVIRKEIKW